MQRAPAAANPRRTNSPLRLRAFLPAGTHWFALGLCFCCALGAGGALGDVASPLLRVGSRALSLEAVQARAAMLPPARVAELGADPRAFVEQVLVPQLLLEEHAERSGVDVASIAARDRALAFALEQSLVREIGVTEPEVEEYFRAHPEEFETPAAILIWRIVCRDEETALGILREVQGNALGVEAWSRAAREHSEDTATRMRRGSLGFVQENGHTEAHEVRVNPEVYRAVSGLRDGELLPQPLKEDGRFSLLWRRGSQPAKETSLKDARATIRSRLTRAKSAAALDALVARLRKERVNVYAPETLEVIDYPAPGASVQRKPIGAAHASPRPDPRPKPTPNGER